MSKKRRKWTPQAKLEVLRDAEIMGVSESSRKHHVSTTMIYRWRGYYEKDGLAGLGRSNSPKDQEKKELEREIERLRQVVADQALTIRIKDELLKKTRYR